MPHILKSARLTFVAACDEIRGALFKRYPDSGPSLVFDRYGKTYADALRQALNTVAASPVVFVLLLLSVAVTVVGFFVVAQIILWLPNEVWVSSSGTGQIGAVPFLAAAVWGLGIIAGMLTLLAHINGAIIVACRRRRTGEAAGLVACLTQANQSIGRQAVIALIDAFKTFSVLSWYLSSYYHASRALETRSGYNTWKLGTLGALPALVFGRSYQQAGETACALFRAAPDRMINIWLGHRLANWIWGSCAVVAWSVFLILTGELTAAPDAAHWFYDMFALALSLPTLICCVTLGVLRPLYSVMQSDLYSDFGGAHASAVEATASTDEYHTLAVGLRAFFLAAAFTAITPLLQACLRP